MYPEFIAIYIGLAILIGLGVVILILLIRLNQNGDKQNISIRKATPVVNQTISPVDITNNSANTVFCTKCATQFSSEEHFCPNCGTPR